MNAKILVVDDDPDIVVVLTDRLQRTGYGTLTARNGHEALDLIKREEPSLILLDLEMPRLSGLEVLKRLALNRQSGAEGCDLPIIVMTGHGTIARAVAAMKAGAYDFVTKPFDMDHLSLVIVKALEHESLKRQVECLRLEVQSRYAAIIGLSPKMKAITQFAQRAARSDACVVLLGESGTGKELFARWIHSWSPRSAMPFVVINCVALADTLLENELFGHEKGAFTGADRLKKGVMELADGGTIFLDEIGDMPLSLQAKLLRVLQDHEFHRVGGTRQVSVNIRVIAATNKDLKQAVKAGTFREDLFFRLNVITLTLPPLRDRKEDIPALAEYFLRQHAEKAKKPGVRFSDQALAALATHAWPGNVRELDNAIARAVILSTEEVITPEYLALTPIESPAAASSDSSLPFVDLPYHESIEEYSRFIISRALQQANGRRTKAAERLKLQPTYLSRLIRYKNI